MKFAGALLIVFGGLLLYWTYGGTSAPNVIGTATTAPKSGVKLV